MDQVDLDFNYLFVQGETVKVGQLIMNKRGEIKVNLDTDYFREKGSRGNLMTKKLKILNMKMSDKLGWNWEVVTR